MVAKIKTTKDNVISVVGTGNAEIDNMRFALAVSAANAFYSSTGRPATILIDREVHIIGEHIFTSPTGLECTKGSWLVRDDSTAKVSYNTSQSATFSYSSAAYGEMTDTAAGAAVISLPYEYQLAAGDWVLIYGFNQISDITPHSTGTKSFPMELQRINRRASTGACNGTGTRCDYVFDDFLDEVYQTVTSGGVTKAPRVAVLPNMMSGIRIRNFNYRMKDAAYSASTAPSVYMSALYFERCHDIELSNCSFGEWHPGTMGFKYCANVRRHGCNWSSVENFEYDSETGVVYGILDSVCNGMDIQNCTFGGMRHAYTTGGTAAASIHSPSTSDRVGTVKSVLIQGNRFGNNGRLSGSTLSGMAMVNPHCEGRRIVISDNQFNVPGEQSVRNIGITVRYRDAVIRNNTFNCGPAAAPLMIYGTRATVANNTFNGGLYCSVNSLNSFVNIDKVRFANNTFRNFVSPAIHITTGTDHEIVGNTFDNCGYQLVTGYKKAAIEIASLTAGGSIRIKDNSIAKYSNDFAIHTGSLLPSQVILDGNLCSGYGGLSLGLDRSLANTAEIEMLSLPRNNGSIKAVVIQQQGHALTASNVGMPITGSHAVYNDVTAGFGVIGVMADRIDSNHYILYLPHEPFLLSPSLVAAGYIFPTGGRDLYWDQSQLKYVATKPGDSAGDSVAIIRVHASKTSGYLVSVKSI